MINSLLAWVLLAFCFLLVAFAASIKSLLAWVLVVFSFMVSAFGGHNYSSLLLLNVLVVGSVIKTGWWGFFLGVCLWVALKPVLQQLIRLWGSLRRPKRPITYQPLPPPPPSRLRYGGVHGDAGWAAIPEIYEHTVPLIPQEGRENASAHMRSSVYLGRFVDPYAIPGSHGSIGPYDGKILPIPIGYAEENNIVTIAPAGSGKGTAAIIPTLLLSQESMFVLDVKGENWFVTAPTRKEQMGQRIVLINPFNVWGKELELAGRMTNHFNPLEHLDHEDDDFVSEIQSLATAMIVEEGKEPHFSLRARQLVACLMAHVCSDKLERFDKHNNLPYVKAILGFDDSRLANYLALAARDSEVPFVRENAASFIQSRKEDDGSVTYSLSREVTSVRATAISQLAFLDVNGVRDFLSSSDFSFNELRKEPMTIYCMFPPEKLDTYFRFARLMVQCFFNRMATSPKASDRRVLALLDEQAKLRNMEIIETSVALLRGYRVRIWSVFQDINQIKKIYGEAWETFISNTGILQIMTPNDATTANYISTRIGDHTLTDTTISKSVGSSTSWTVGSSYTSNSGPIGSGGSSGSSSSHGGGTSESTTANQSRVKMPFLSVQELYAMPRDRSLIFVKGLKYPVMATRDSYMAMGKTFFGAAYAPHPVHDHHAFEWLKGILSNIIHLPQPASKSLPKTD